MERSPDTGFSVCCFLEDVNKIATLLMFDLYFLDYSKQITPKAGFFVSLQVSKKLLDNTTIFFSYFRFFVSLQALDIELGYSGYVSLTTIYSKNSFFVILSIRLLKIYLVLELTAHT